MDLRAKNLAKLDALGRHTTVRRFEEHREAVNAASPGTPFPRWTWERWLMVGMGSGLPQLGVTTALNGIYTVYTLW